MVHAGEVSHVWHLVEFLISWPVIAYKLIYSK